MTSAQLDEMMTSRSSGKERDTETGLDYFGARYYSSNLGRFLSPDEFTGGPMDLYGPNPTVAGPLPYADITNPQSLTKYSYTYNNPLRYIDNDGHDIDPPPASHQAHLDQLRKESRTFDQEWKDASADHRVKVDIQDKRRPSDLPSHSAQKDSNGVIIIHIFISPKDQQAPHEFGHEKDARTNYDQYKKDEKPVRDDQANGGKRYKDKHDTYPIETRANDFANQVAADRKQYKKDEKEKKKR